MTGDPRSLSELLRWFRHEWQEEMGSGRIHVHLTDDGGTPEWHDLFKRVIELPSVDSKVDDDALNPGSDDMGLPMRYHLRRMAHGSKRGWRRAEYLFALACHDFDVLAAARSISRLGAHEDAEDWVRDYAEACLRALHERSRNVTTVDSDGRPRKYLPRTGKSESQHNAEAA